MNKKIIFIGGAASVGKTTLISNINKLRKIYAIEKGDIYRRLAKDKNISFKDVFTKISENDYVDYMLKILETEDVMVVGLHYAIQPQKDTLLSMGLPSSSKEEIYISSISENVVSLLKDSSVDIIYAVMTAKPNTLFYRSFDRNKQSGQIVRNHTLEETIREIEAENYFFEQCASTVSNSFVVDIEGKNPQIVCMEVISQIEQLKLKESIVKRLVKGE